MKIICYGFIILVAIISCIECDKYKLFNSTSNVKIFDSSSRNEIKTFHMRPYKHIVDFSDVSDLSVYYDLKSNQKLRKMMPRPWYKPGWPLRLPFEGGTCDCSELHCSCCTGLNITQFHFNRRVCANFDYQPEEFLVLMNVTVNDTRIFTTEISAKNPPPFCVPIPIPYLPPGFVDYCIRIFDVYIKDQKLHMCMDMDTRIDRAPVLVLHFDCMLMGLDGVNLVKPGESESTASTNSDAEPQDTEGEQNDGDVYDQVDDLKDETNTNSLLPSSI